MQFVTADTHFLDEHLLGIDDFAPRPFLTVDQMDQTIIKNWNERVSEDDIVYHLYASTSQATICFASLTTQATIQRLIQVLRRTQ